MIAVLFCVCVVSASRLVPDYFARQEARLNLIPLPTTVQWPQPAWACGLKPQLLGLQDFAASFPGAVAKLRERTARVLAAGESALNVQPISAESGSLAGSVDIEFELSYRTAVTVPQFGDDEAYAFGVTRPNGTRVRVYIDAASSTGIVRGFSVFLQLLARRASDRAACIPVGLDIVDNPQHVWRGLLVDVARRFKPLDELKGVCDGLEFARMNVLHLHLVDDQGWRFESFAWPRLHQVGTLDGKHFTQAQLRELVAYCAEGGVRVVPEMAMPSHSSAAIFAYPELAPDHYPRKMMERWGIHDFSLDPSLPVVGTFVRDIVAELAAVFPDRFLHIGGDEVVWNTPSARQQEWMNANGLTLETLQTYFTVNIALPALEAVGRQAIGWNEVFQSAKGDVNIAAIQWWTSAAFSGAATDNVLSTGYFLDYNLNAEELYMSGYMQEYDQGGEACMWTEHVEVNLRTRVFPGLLALSEVLWRSKRNRISVESARHRMFVQESTLRLVGPDTGQEFASNIANLISKTGAISRRQNNDESQSTLALLLSLMVPSRVRADRRYPVDDLMDVARPNSAELQVLTWLASDALAEELDPTRPATVALMRFLHELATLPAGALPLAFQSLLEEVRSSAIVYLSWIRAVQTGSNGDLEYESALSTGSSSIQGVFTPFRYVLNGLKSSVEPVLLVRNVGPYNYDPAVVDAVTATSSAEVSPGNQPTNQPTESPTSAPTVQEADSSLVIGLTVGLVMAAVLAVIIVILQWRRGSQRQANLVALIADAVPMSDMVTFDEEEDGDDGAAGLSYLGGGNYDESYVDYCDNNDAEFSYLGGGGGNSNDGELSYLGGGGGDGESDGIVYAPDLSNLGASLYSTVVDDFDTTRTESISLVSTDSMVIEAATSERDEEEDEEDEYEFL